MPRRTQTTNLGALHGEARDLLVQAGIEAAALDARLLVEHFTGTTRADAIADPGRAIDATASAAVWEAVHRRSAREPVHRILGHREFYGLDLMISPETLEPRPDTEALVDLCLPFLREAATGRGGCRILDLGTGTGAIALALLSQIPQAVAIGTDISVRALETAVRNANINGVENRFEAILSDWFVAVNGTFTLIVSNPPYIPSGDIAGLEPEVRNHDPAKALDGGADGLDAYRMIASGAKKHLEENGRVAVEMGFDQQQPVTGIFEAEGFSLTEAVRDLGGNDRALMFQTV